MEKLTIGFLFGVGVGYILFWVIRENGRKRRPSAFFTGVTFDNQTVKGVIEMVELKEGQKAVLHVSPRSKHGHSGAIEPGSARFTSSDESVVSVEQNPENELEATIRGLDGSSNEPVVIAFKADGDRSEGVKEIVGSASVVCTQGDALTFDLEVGPAEDDAEASEPQPEPAPASEPQGGDVNGAELASGNATADATEPASDTVPPAGEGTAASGADDAAVKTGDEPKDGNTADGGKVKAGDPGTATGEPIPADNPNKETTVPTPEGVEAGQPANADPSADPKNTDPADRIEAGGPGAANDPNEGKTPAGDDASPSNEVTGPTSGSGSF